MTVLGYCEPLQNRSRRLPLQFRYRHKGMGKKAGKDGGSKRGRQREDQVRNKKKAKTVCMRNHVSLTGYGIDTALKTIGKKSPITDHGIFSALPPMIELRMNLF